MAIINITMAQLNKLVSENAHLTNENTKLRNMLREASAALRREQAEERKAAKNSDFTPTERQQIGEDYIAALNKAGKVNNIKSWVLTKNNRFFRSNLTRISPKLIRQMRAFTKKVNKHGGHLSLQQISSGMTLGSEATNLRQNLVKTFDQLVEAVLPSLGEEVVRKIVAWWNSIGVDQAIIRQSGSKEIFVSVLDALGQVQWAGSDLTGILTPAEEIYNNLLVEFNMPDFRAELEK